ncbi:hypothetical protein M404DRAFT_638644 [Pisolithus tinctorius Marx 270]|uniref:Major facilitator superfamily (MFS) profile domain-containing protein n=1 Tax=Pisolithus tinctorius Marx 270 TaxID=870435 RepID=A0A0C3MVG1_PISTI|nr:hypothetical protein M404DRAFT_638644 [Pisolithus tinctorius Marx 270]
MAMGHVDDAGRRVGMYMTIAALGTLAGTPISGAINARTGGFKGPGFYAGHINAQRVIFVDCCRWRCHVFGSASLRGTISPSRTAIWEVLVSYEHCTKWS